MPRAALIVAQEKLLLALTDLRMGLPRKPRTAAALEKATGLTPERLSAALTQLRKDRKVVLYPVPPGSKRLPTYGVTSLIASALREAATRKKACSFR